MMKTVNPAMSSNKPKTTYLPAEEVRAGTDAEDRILDRRPGLPGTLPVLDFVWAGLVYGPAGLGCSAVFELACGLRFSHASKSC